MRWSRSAANVSSLTYATPTFEPRGNHPSYAEMRPHRDGKHLRRELDLAQSPPYFREVEEGRDHAISRLEDCSVIRVGQVTDEQRQDLYIEFAGNFANVMLQ